MEPVPAAIPRIFVSHSHEDVEFGRSLATFLDKAGADVWYDEHHMVDGGELPSIIGEQLRNRPICIVILSHAAMASQWVRLEVQAALDLKIKDPARIMLPVIAGPLDKHDFQGPWVLLQHVTRIGESDTKPFPPEMARRRTLQALQKQLPSADWKPVDEDPVLSVPSAARDVNELIKTGQESLLGQPDKALAYFRQAVQRKADSYQAQFYLGNALEKLGQNAEAHDAFTTARRLVEGEIARDRKNPRFWYDEGMILYYLNERTESLKAFEQALRLAPRPLLSRVKLGEVNSLEAGVTAFERKYGKGLSFDRMWYLKGCSLLDRGDFDDAERALRKIPPEGDQPRDYWFQLGRAYHHQKSRQAHEDAIKVLERAAMVEPESAAVLSELGEVLGTTARAVEAFQKALMLEPQRTFTRRQLAHVLDAMKQFDEAIAVLDDGLMIDGSNTDLLTAKWSIERQAGRLQAAAETRGQLASLTGSAQDWKGAGELYMEAHQYMQAVSAYEHATAISPQDSRVRDSLKKAREALFEQQLSMLRARHAEQVRTGQREAAAETLTSIAEMTGEAKDWADVASLYIGIKHDERADQAFDNAIRAAPLVPHWREEKAVWLEQRAQEMRQQSDLTAAEASMLRREARRLRSMFYRGSELAHTRRERATELIRRAQSLAADAEAKRHDGDNLRNRAHRLRDQVTNLRRAEELDKRADKHRDEAERLGRKEHALQSLEGSGGNLKRVRRKAKREERMAQELERKAQEIRDQMDVIP